MTVKQFIEANPEARLDLFTPGGYVILTPEQCQSLLQGKPVSASNGFSGPENVRKVKSDELLPQMILQVGEREGNTWHFLTDFSEESSLPEDADPMVRFKTRLDDQYRAFEAEQLMLDPYEVFKNADEIAAAKQVYETLKDGYYSQSELDFLLKQDDVLATLAGMWCSYNDVDHSEELDQVIFRLRQELDQEEEQEQGPTMEALC